MQSGQMEDGWREDNKRTEDELEINNTGSSITNAESTYVQSDAINYKGLIEI